MGVVWDLIGMPDRSNFCTGAYIQPPFGGMPDRSKLVCQIRPTTISILAHTVVPVRAGTIVVVLSSFAVYLFFQCNE